MADGIRNDVLNEIALDVGNADDEKQASQAAKQAERDGKEGMVFHADTASNSPLPLFQWIEINSALGPKV